MRGFVNFYKPENMTSNDAVVKVRGVLKGVSGDKKLKVGHLGTLDPLATGVLPIAVGRATRLFDLLLNKDKTYIATFKFGMTTDTLDMGGRVTRTEDANIGEEQAISAAQAFVGEFAQLPPQYSAKSIGGRRAYDIARSGGYAELAPKNVKVYSINQAKLENLSKNEYGFEIKCSSGTYIRALARDIAEKLGTVGCMTSLKRVASGPFDIENAVAFDEFASDPLKYLLPIEFALGDMQEAALSNEQAARALNGVKVDADMPDGDCKVTLDGETVAIGEVKDKKLFLRTRL